MARPLKEGVDYWNIDVDFFQNKKVRLLRGEFGIRGVYIYVLILNDIYRERGYYKKWDFDDCFLMSDSPGVGGDCSPNLIAEIVQGCVRRSLFDKRVFDVFGVLTSAEIQRRFLSIVGNSRDKISMIEEYFLLDTSNRKDVTGATLGKITLFSISGKDNAVSLKGNPQKLTDNPQSKVKESKEENSRSSNARTREENQSAFGRVYALYESRIGYKPSTAAVGEMQTFVDSLGEDVVTHAINLAIDRGKVQEWPYIRGILRRYESGGLTTMEAVLRSEREHEQRKREGRQRNGTYSRNNGNTGTGAGGNQGGIPKKSWNVHNDLDDRL